MSLALGVSLAEIADMSAAEFGVWRDWYSLHGFPSERGEFVTANAGAYIGGVWGGKARVDQLLPRSVHADEPDDISGVIAWLETVGSKG